MSSNKSAYPWFFFYRIARLVLIVFLPTLFLILFLYRSSYKSGLVSQMSIQIEEEMRLLKYTVSSTGIDWVKWCQNLPKLGDVHYTLVKDDDTILCDNQIPDRTSEKIFDTAEIAHAFRDGFSTEFRKSDLFKTQAVFAGIRLTDDLVLRKVIPVSSLRNNMDRFDRVLFLRIVPFAVLSYFLFVYLFYLSTKPLGIILSKVEKFKDDIPFNKNLQLLYEKNEWAAIEEALNKADQKLKTQVEEAQAENAKNTTILESIAEDIIAVDKFETILFFNTKFKNDFMISAEESRIVPKLWQIFSDENVLQAFRSVLISGKPSTLKGMNFLGSPRPDRFFDLTVTPLRSGEGSVTGALGVFHDVTEFKLSEQMRVDFVANVSHEIRTPLTSVKGYTQILQSQSSLVDESLRPFLDKIIANTERMISLFNDLLNLSVLESRNIQVFEQIDLVEMVEAVASNIITNYPQKDVEITHELSLSEVRGDYRLMEQVLTNLIDNACKYSERESIAIKVSSLERNGKAYISIADNGPGINREHLQRIFERFYRVDSSREVSRGTGLGLSIVKHIVNKHKGRIWAESEGEGKGTTFVIELPLE